MKLLTLLAALALALAPAWAQPAPLEVTPCGPGTWILRERLASTWEAPFLYLLAGNRRALLIDTGDVADPAAMPLARTVRSLLPEGLPLLVVHSHGHLDHRTGDVQFVNLPGVEVVPADLEHVRRFFGFKDWPEGQAALDLGGRILDVLPAPGHHPAHVLYYDRNGATLFSGDFLLPGRLLVSDRRAYLASAERAAAFLKDRPVCQILGGHIEKNRAGALYAWEAPQHPDEAPLALAKADLLALPGALRAFNGFYTTTGTFVLENPNRILVAAGIGLFLVLAGLVFGLYRWFQRRRRRAALKGSATGHQGRT